MHVRLPIEDVDEPEKTSGRKDTEMKNPSKVGKPQLTRSSFLLRMAAALLLLNLFVIGLMVLSLRQSREQYEKRAADVTRNLAQVLDEHIDGIIDKTEVILFAAVEEFENRYARGGINRLELEAFLDRTASRMPELERLTVADARGRVFYHTGTGVGALTNVSDREYFLHLRDNPGAGLYISKPIKSRISGRWVVVLARRLTLKDGSFAGTVATALSLDYINRLFASINVGPHGAIALRDGELGLIARCPEPAGTGSIIGQKKVSREMAELYQAGKTKGTYKTTTPVDRIERTYSFRRLSQYPLYIVVGLADSDYLKEWRGEVAKMTVAALLFLLVTLISSLLIYKGWRSRTDMIGALAEQEVKYRTVADYTYHWEYWLGPDGAFRYVSPSCKRITGYDAERFYEDPGLINRLIHHDDRELYAAHRCEELNGADNLVFRIVRADGSIRWLEHACRPIVDEAGNFLGNRCCNRDITERKLAEQSLRETFFSVDHASIPIFWIGEDSRFLYANRACDYLGYSREELLGMSVYDIDPDFSKEELARIQEAIRERGSFTFERRHKTKAGVLIPVEVTRQDIQLPGQKFHVSYVRDISERKATEAMIARSEQKFRAIFESAHDAIFLIAADSRYVDCNPAAADMFGCGKEDLLTRNPQQFSPPSQPDGRESGQKVFDLIAAALEGKAQSFEWRHRRPDGSEFDAMVVLSRFELDNEPMLLAIVRDISQKKNLESQLYHMQKMESIGTLAGGIAHDFNNLMTVITGYGHIIKMRMEPDDPQLAMIEQILYSSDRAAQLTQGLLAFSRKQTIDPRPVDLNDIVKGVERLLERLIGADIDFMTKLAGMPLKIFADAGQIEQVLMNLAANARDAMPEGGELTITTEEICQRHFSFHGLIKPGKYALITVTDTGNGMDEQTRAKIFEPFFTTKEIGHGTGLGLAIVYGIIKQHNGFINVYSELGKGTTFQIHLPLISEMLKDTDTNAEPQPRGGTETILLAEDDHIVRKMAEIFLRDFGYRVIEAVDGEDALDKFARHEQEIDLLILDVIMPKKNGAEVYSTVKSVRPDVDILFISGYTADMIRKKGIPEQEIEFMSKPVSPFDLLRKIREMRDKKLSVT
jgi:PAS domain S-box-containing protein